jgi:dienelactone hydrolase
MQHEIVEYAADGLPMIGHVFLERTAEPRPGVLVYPEAYGLNQHAIERAERLAALGYIAMACDLHGRGLVEDDLGAAIGMLEPLYADPRKTRARATAALQALATRIDVDPERIGAMGHCFGGTMCLELARSGADVKAVVGFHSGLATVAPKAGVNTIKAKILVCIGSDDPFIPDIARAEFEREMRESGADWQMNLYGGVVHSFTNRNAASAQRPDAVRYDARADERSWMAMQALFSETFG